MAMLRRLVLVITVIAVAISFGGAPTGAHHDRGGTIVAIGGGGVLDYSTAVDVEVTPTGEIFAAGYSTTSFSADTAIDGFDLWIQRRDLAGALVWSRALAPVAGGLPHVEVHADGAGAVWLIANDTVFGFDAATGVSLPAWGTTITRDSVTEIRGAANGGLVVATPADDTLRSYAADGTERWDAPLPAGTDTLDLVSLSGLTFAMTCEATGGVTTTHTVVNDAGTVTYSGIGVGRFAADSLTPTTADNAVHVDLAHPDAADTTCTGAPASMDPVQVWEWWPPVGFTGGSSTTHAFAGTYCLAEHLTEPVVEQTTCVPGFTPTPLEVSGALMFRAHAATSGVTTLMQDDDGVDHIVRSVDGEITEVLRLEADELVRDIAIMPTGEIVAVGTEFGIGSTDPDEPFNARGFILIQALGGDSEPLVVLPFVDVVRDWQIEPVVWAWTNGITEGVDPTHFAPDRPITRAEAVAMMYRERGEPPMAGHHPFIDVLRSWQHLPITWAWANGTTVGVDPTHFAPDRPITRAEALAMMHREVGSPTPSTAHPFTDIRAAWQELPVRWGYETGITVGVSPTEFGPDRPITRAEFVAMLYRRQLIDT